MDLDSLLLMAQYNIWATQRLCQNLESVSDDDFYKDVGLHFKSIFGTLNHLLLGEHYLWYSRFAQGISPSLKLNNIIEADRNKSLEQLRLKSYQWLPFIETLDHERLHGNLSYTRVNGEQLTLPFMPTLLHVFNHGTHHRGQVTAAMTAMGYECPELDLVYMLVEQESAKANSNQA
ncbi:DinB family protein [Acinetobacter sp. TY1]|uniref:DinB family protein n=1 Tax=Acinetobacter sp. TY1 TaxID=3387626 RepID=UPI003AF84FFB